MLGEVAMGQTGVPSGRTSEAACRGAKKEGEPAARDVHVCV